MEGAGKLRVVHVHKKFITNFGHAQKVHHKFWITEYYAGKMAKRVFLTWLAILVRAFCLMLLMAYKNITSKFMYFNVVPILICHLA
jgi:hypothetical protein